MGLFVVQPQLPSCSRAEEEDWEERLEVDAHLLLAGIRFALRSAAGDGSWRHLHPEGLPRLSSVSLEGGETVSRGKMEGRLVRFCPL